MTARLDHLVYGTADLGRGVAEVARLTGVAPQPGGRHTGFGTRNALTGLGGGAYFEVIAPDPEQAHTSPMRTMLESLAAPRLLTWAVATDDMDTDAALVEAAGVDLEPMMEMERPAGDTVLRWRLRRPVDPADGVVPFLIDWGATRHPSAVLPSELSLVVLHVATPFAERLTAMLRALGVDGVEVRDVQHPTLWATIANGDGTLSL
jgi:hypothetical protein